jgi:hypothetical protein
VSNIGRFSRNEKQNDELHCNPVHLAYTAVDQLINVNKAKAPAARRKYVECTVNGCAVQLQLDSAADVTILDKDTWIAIGRPSLSPIDGVLIGVGNYPMSTIGIAQELSVVLNGKRRVGRAYVANTNGSLFGIEWMDQFELWDECPSSYSKKFSATNGNYPHNALLSTRHNIREADPAVDDLLPRKNILKRGERIAARDQLPFEELCREVPTKQPDVQVVKPKRKDWRAVTRTDPIELRPRRT